MPNRDYAARSNRAGKGVNKILVLVIVVLILALSGLALWFLQTNTPVQPAQPTVKSTQPKQSLPTPPEEVYSYIRDLENREVPIDKNSNVARLTKEQEQLLQQQKEEEKRKQAQFEQQQAQQNQPTEPQNSPSNETEEQKVADEKQKADLKKQQEQVKKEPEQKAKPEQVKTVAKPNAEQAKIISKFGLQCGAFKNRAQAENMQARLVMAGFNARINSSGEWNRVVVGPIGERAVAVRSQANARSVAECLVVAM